MARKGPIGLFGAWMVQLVQVGHLRVAASKATRSRSAQTSTPRRHRRRRSRSRTLPPTFGDVSVGDAGSFSWRGPHRGEPFDWLLSHFAAAANGKQANVATLPSGTRAGEPHARPQPRSPPKQPCSGRFPQQQLARTVFVRLVAPLWHTSSKQPFIACMLLLAGEENWANVGALGAPGEAHVLATLHHTYGTSFAGMKPAGCAALHRAPRFKLDKAGGGIVGRRGDDRFGPSAGVLLLIYSRGAVVPRIR